MHTWLLSPASQFDVADVGGVSADEGAERFPVPVMPQAGITGNVETGEDANRTSEQVDEIMRDLDDGLGQ